MGAPLGNKNAAGSHKGNVYSHTKSGKIKKPWPYWNPKGKSKGKRKSYFEHSKTIRGRAEIAAIMGLKKK